jgi:flagellar biosynthesis/type III secretory pathway chaperone
MQAERTQHPLYAVLTQEVDCSERLLACLAAERTALTHRDTPALEQSTQEKIAQIQLLERLEQQREKLVVELGFAPDAEGLRRCLKTLSGDSELLQLWHRILKNIDACQASNLTNGGILEQGRQAVERALSILRGQSGAPSRYDPKGAASTDLGQRDLGKV